MAGDVQGGVPTQAVTEDEASGLAWKCVKLVLEEALQRPARTAQMPGLVSDAHRVGPRGVEPYDGLDGDQASTEG